MKHQIGMALVLLSMSSVATGEWVKVSSSAAATAYVDPSTIRKVGNRAKAWTMIDHRVAQPYLDGERYKSIKAQSEVDCYEEKEKTLFIAMFDGNLGAGQALGNPGIPPDTRWKPVPPGTLLWLTLKAICKN